MNGQQEGIIDFSFSEKKRTLQKEIDRKNTSMFLPLFRFPFAI